MNKIKQITFEKVYFIILCLNILLLNIAVGSTHDAPNRTFTQFFIILETLIYIIITKIKKQERILIKGKIDIAVIAMMVITFVPLICKTYCSLSYTIEISIIYFTVYSMYILVRNLVTTPKRKNIFINVMLLSSTIIIIFGIDRINFSVFQKFYDISLSSQVFDARMTSTIGYWNAVFAYIVSLMIIALGKYLSIENKKVAGLYAMYICFAMYAFYFCNSRAGMIIFALVFIAYLIKLKNINKAVQSILLLICTYGLVLAFDKINTAYNTHITVIAGVIIDLITTYVFSKVLKRIENTEIKNAKRNAIIIIAILIVGGTTYIAIAKNYSKPFELKKWGNSVILYDLKNNNKYKVKLDLTAKTGEQLTVKVFQIDSRRARQCIYEQTYIAKDGKVVEEFEIETNQENLDKVQIQFVSVDKSEWILNKIYVNEKEDIVNYKYLPNSLMRLTKTLSFNNLSVAERLSMYKSGFQLFLEHPIVGNGAKTFANMYEKVREYGYGTMEVHSFYMDILMDYGIIGIITCFSIIGITIYNFIKRKDKNNIVTIVIFTSWIFAAIHTMFDFDLAYMLTLANFYIVIALINEEDKNITKNTKLVEYAVIVIMAICVVINGFRLIGDKLYREGKYKEAIAYMPYYVKNMNEYIKSNEDRYGLSRNLKKEIIIKYLNNEKNTYQYDNIKYLYEISIDLIKTNNIKEGIEGLQEIIKLIENNDIIVKYDIKQKDSWKQFVDNMKNEVQELSTQLDNEKLNEINEEVQTRNDEERRRRYGQADHYRNFGTNFIEILKKHKFKVEEINSDNMSKK